MKKKTSPYTPTLGSKSLTKYCENLSLWGRFLTPTLLHGLIWSKMLFSNFLSSTRWLLQIFFRKISNLHLKVPNIGERFCHSKSPLDMHVHTVVFYILTRNFCSQIHVVTLFTIFRLILYHQNLRLAHCALVDNVRRN